MMMQTQDLTLEGNKLSAKFSIDHTNKPSPFTIASPSYTIAGLVNIQLLADGTINERKDFRGHIFLVFKQCYENDTTEYQIKLSSESFKITEKYYYCTKQPAKIVLYTYHGPQTNVNSPSSQGTAPIQFVVAPNRPNPSVFGGMINGHNNTNLKYQFDLDIKISIKENPKFSFMYDDTDVTDFELIGEDGALSIHRCVLANQSSALKAMFSATGTWKEKRENSFKVMGKLVKAKTLEHLKKYLYLDQLPDTSSDLEELLKIGHCYDMQDLIQACCSKILFCVTEENVLLYSVLAHEYKLKKIFHGIQEIIQTLKLTPNSLVSKCGGDWI